MKEKDQLISGVTALVLFIAALSMPEKYEALAWAFGTVALVLVFRAVAKGKW